EVRIGGLRDRAPPRPRPVERRHGELLAVAELFHLGYGHHPLRALEPVELLLPREVADHPHDRIDRAEAPRRFLGGHGLEPTEPFAAREPELRHQRMRHALALFASALVEPTRVRPGVAAATEHRDGGLRGDYCRSPAEEPTVPTFDREVCSRSRNAARDRKSTRLTSSHQLSSYAVLCF